MSQHINLFNPNLFEKKSWFTAVILARASIVAAIILLVLWSAFQWQVGRLDRVQQASARQLASMNAALAEAKAHQLTPTHNPVFAQQLATLQSEISQRQKAVEILGTDKLGNTDGFSEYMAAFARQIPERVWLTGFDFDANGERLSIHGRALQAELVPVFLSQLKKEKLMRGKTFAALDLQRPNAEPSSNAQERQKTETAPYLEFEFHTTEAEVRKDAGVKQP